jgi:DNA-binding transcriptional LysR family regulator
MEGRMPWNDRIGRRLKLRDLDILLTVAQAGSMGKAAGRLAMSQPVVSKAIADMEHALGVRLLDRSRRGVELTAYGQAVIRRGAAVFDELRECVREIEFLADPSVGTVTVGGDSPRVAGLLPAVIGRLRRRYPRIDVHVVEVAGIPQQHRALRERTVDLIVGRLAPPLDDDLSAEVLFQERTYVVAGPRSRWARRRKIDLAELVEGPWSVPPHDSAVGVLVAEAFRGAGVPYPPAGLVTGSVHLHSALMADGPFLSFIPDSMLRFGLKGLSVKVLPVELPTPPSPAGIMTLKNRTLGPVTRLFIDSVREIVKPLRDTVRGKRSD